MKTTEQKLQHEIRTPLTTIFGMLTFLKRGPLTHEQQLYLDSIKKSATTLLNFANRLTPVNPKISSVKGSKPQVLLIEDNISIQWIHQKMLQDLGCKVVLACNGKEALRLAYHDYDLILIDIGLPDLSGIELARRFRAYSNHQYTRIISLTAYTDEATKKQCLLAGIEKVIPKPISCSTFEFLVKSLHRDQQPREKIEAC